MSTEWFRIQPPIPGEQLVLTKEKKMYVQAALQATGSAASRCTPSAFDMNCDGRFDLFGIPSYLVYLAVAALISTAIGFAVRSRNETRERNEIMRNERARKIAAANADAANDEPPAKPRHAAEDDQP